MNDGADAPAQTLRRNLKTPITRVTDATERHARSPPSNRDYRSFMNDPGSYVRDVKTKASLCDLFCR